MMKKIITIFILIISIQVYGQSHTGNWSFSKLSSDSVTTVEHFLFADSGAGYIGCNYQAHQYSDVISRWYRTLDGGLTWTPITFNGIPLFLTQPPHGVGGQVCAPTHNSIFTLGGWPYIYKSLDNGDHWDTVHTDLQLDKFFTMFTANQGIGIGGPENYPFIVETYNGGNSFLGSYHDSLFTASLATSGYFSAQFSDQFHGTCIIEDADINNGKGLTTLVTNNQGTSWEKYHTDFPGYKNYALGGGIQYQRGTPNLWMMPYRSGIILNTVNGTRGGINYPPDFKINYCFSTDYGISWSYDTSFARNTAIFYGISPGNIWLTLHDGLEINELIPSYKIAHTIDYGKSWDIDSITLNNDGIYAAQGIYFTDANHGWIVALHKGMPYIFIYHPVKNSVIEHGLSARKQLPVFPVPAANQVTINLPLYDVALDAQVYDIVGRQYHAAYKIQNNTVVIDTHDLPAGIWLAIVKHTYGTNTSRFILQK